MALSQTGLGALNLVPEDASGPTRVSTQTQRELDAKNVVRLVREDLEDVEDDLADSGDGRPDYLRGEFGANLLDERDVDRPVELFARQRIASELLRSIEADLESRKQWEEMAARAIQFMGMIYEEASGEVSSEGSISKAWSTIMLESCVSFWANAYAEFLPPDGPAKIRDDKPSMAGIGHNGGPPLDDPAEDQADTVNRIALAEAFEHDFNHYLLVGDKQYYRDFSRMLMSLGPKGTEFRKIYKNPLRRMVVSEWVKSENLIISNEAADISTAERVTERIRMSQAKVRRLQWMGHWLDVKLTLPHDEPTMQQKKIAELEGIKPEPELPADYQHTFYEVYCERDLEGFEHTDEDGERTGLPLPYRFTVDKDSRQLVECRRDWKEDDELFQKRQHYVMFGLIPGFGLYYLGYCHLLGNTERAATAITREMIDSGMMAIFPGWVAAKGALPKGQTQIRVGPMGVQEINTAMGKRVGDSIEPIPMKPLDPNVLALLEKLESNARNVAGKLELPQGEGTQNIPVGTMIAIIEQSTKMSMAVHKGTHASRAEELELLRESIAEEPEMLTRYAKSPRRKEWIAEEFQDMDLVPSSDPNTPSHVHRLMRGVGIAQIAQMFPPGPEAQRNIAEDLYRILQVPNPSRYLPDLDNPAPPQPSPQEIAAQAKMGVAQLQAQMKQRDLDIQQQTAAADRASKERIAQTDLQAEQIKAGGQIQAGILRQHDTALEQARDHAHTAHQASLDRQHEAQQSGLDRMHEQQTDAAQRMHDQQTQQADQQHEVATASLGRPTPNRPL